MLRNIEDRGSRRRAWWNCQTCPEGQRGRRRVFWIVENRDPNVAKQICCHGPRHIGDAAVVDVLAQDNHDFGTSVLRLEHQRRQQRDASAHPLARNNVAKIDAVDSGIGVINISDQRAGAGCIVAQVELC